MNGEFPRFFPRQNSRASVRLGVGDVGAAGSAICTLAAQQRGEAKSSLHRCGGTRWGKKKSEVLLYVYVRICYIYIYHCYTYIYIYYIYIYVCVYIYIYIYTCICPHISHLSSPHVMSSFLHLMILSCSSKSWDVFRLATPSKKVSASRSTTSPLGAMP